MGGAQGLRSRRRRAARDDQERDGFRGEECRALDAAAAGAQLRGDARQEVLCAARAQGRGSQPLDLERAGVHRDSPGDRRDRGGERLCTQALRARTGERGRAARGHRGRVSSGGIRRVRGRAGGRAGAARAAVRSRVLHGRAARRPTRDEGGRRAFCGRDPGDGRQEPGDRRCVGRAGQRRAQDRVGPRGQRRAGVRRAGLRAGARVAARRVRRRARDGVSQNVRRRRVAASTSRRSCCGSSTMRISRACRRCSTMRGRRARAWRWAARRARRIATWRRPC